MLEMAYRLSVSEQPMIQRIRQQLVVLINPSFPIPDGRRQDGGVVLPLPQGARPTTPLCLASPLPTGRSTHSSDINRRHSSADARDYQAVHRMFHDWHPTVVHDLHEGSPFLMTWNGTGPYNPNIDTHHLHRVFGAELSRSSDSDGHGHGLVSPLGISARPSPISTLIPVAMNHNSIGRGYTKPGGQRHSRDAAPDHPA